MWLGVCPDDAADRPSPACPRFVSRRFPVRILQQVEAVQAQAQRQASGAPAGGGQPQPPPQQQQQQRGRRGRQQRRDRTELQVGGCMCDAGTLGGKNAAVDAFAQVSPFHGTPSELLSTHRSRCCCAGTKSSSWPTLRRRGRSQPHLLAQLLSPPPPAVRGPSTYPRRLRVRRRTAALGLALQGPRRALRAVPAQRRVCGLC